MYNKKQQNPMRINWRDHRQQNSSGHYSYKPKSIHALAPSSVKSPTTRNTSHKSDSLYKYYQTQSTHVDMSQPHPTFSSSVTRRQNNNRLIQNLFTDQSTILKNLQKQAKDLQDQRQRIISKNQEEYQIMVEKLMSMRKMCNQRQLQIASLKVALRNIEEENKKTISQSHAERRQSYSRQKRQNRMSMDHERQ